MSGDVFTDGIVNTAAEEDGFKRFYRDGVVTAKKQCDQSLKGLFNAAEGSANIDSSGNDRSSEVK